MNILEELYYGNIAPFEKGFGKSRQRSDLQKYVSRHEQALTAAFSEEQKATFEKYRDNTQELQQLGELEAFICGFKLGGQLMLEVAQGNPGCAIEE